MTYFTVTVSDTHQPALPVLRKGYPFMKIPGRTVALIYGNELPEYGTWRGNGSVAVNLPVNLKK